MTPKKSQEAWFQEAAKIIGVLVAMGGIFAVLERFLPANLIPPIGAVVIGFIVTIVLVRGGKWDWKTALITWLGMSVVLVIIYLIISRPATIVGSVVDRNNRPMVGLQLVLRDSSGVSHEVCTDDNGDFEIRNVPEGEFTISVGGQLLFSKSVPSGWKRIFEPVVNTGKLAHTPMTPTATPISPPTPTQTPTDTLSPPPAPSATSPFTPTNTPTLALKATPDTPTATATHTPTGMATHTPTPSPTATPISLPACTPPERLNGKIAYPVYGNGRKCIFIAYLEGDGVRRDTSTQKEDASEPAISPNGSEIAFRSWDNNCRGLMVMNIDGTNLRRVSWTSALEDACPYWAQGESLVFHSTRKGSTPRLYTAGTWEGAENVESVQDVMRGTEPAYGRYPAWVPGGRIVYEYFEQSGNFRGLWVMNQDGSNPVSITDHPGDTVPSVSPRGDKVAFMSERTGRWEVYVVNIDGRGFRQLTNSGGYNSGLPTWSPDGNHIAFVSDRDNQWAIWVMKSNGSCERKLFNLDDGTLNWAERISWAP